MLRRLWHPATTALLLAIVVILLSRDLTIVTAPALEYEDASHVFAHFYSHRQISELLRFKAGYIPLLPNLIGFTAVRLPTRLIPFGLAVPPLLLASITYTIFFAGAYRRYLSSDLLRGVTCLLFALAPLSHYALISSTDYCIWNALFLLILILFQPAPSRLAASLGRWLLSTLLIWSNPLSIVCIPLAIDALRREKQARAHHLAILASLVAYQCLGVAHLDKNTGTGLTPLEILRAIALGINHAARTMLRSLYGPALDLRLTWAGLAGTSVMIAFLILMLTAILFYARTAGPDAQRFSAHACFLIIAVPTMSALGRGVEYISQYHARYAYIPSLLTIILMLAVIDAVIHQSSSHRFQLWSRRWSCCWLLLSYTAMNIQEGYYHLRTIGASQDSPYGQNRPASEKVSRFFEALANAETHNPPQPAKIGINRGPGWTFEVYVRSQN